MPCVVHCIISTQNVLIYFLNHICVIHIICFILSENFPPNDLKIVQDEKYKNEVTVSWKQPNKPADKYVVQYKEIGDSEEFLLVPCDNQKLTCTVENLTAGNEYQFRVAAINERGDYGLFAKERCHSKL